jgi:hypothetical protein
MDRFIQRENLALFKKRLAEPHTATEHEILLKLLAGGSKISAARKRRVKPLSWPTDTARSRQLASKPYNSECKRPIALSEQFEL